MREKRERIQQGDKTVRGGEINLHRRMNQIIAKVKEMESKVSQWFFL